MTENLEQFLLTNKDRLLGDFFERLFDEPAHNRNLPGLSKKPKGKSHNFKTVEETPFENPLLFHAKKEFSQIYDFICSADFLENPAEKNPIPVARTYVKYHTLNNAGKIPDYPLLLKSLILEALAAAKMDQAEHINFIHQKSDRLLMTLFEYLTGVREELYRLKLRELESGVFYGETTGCPSAVLEGEKK